MRVVQGAFTHGEAHRGRNELVLRASPKRIAAFLLVAIGSLGLAGLLARAAILFSSDPATLEVAKRFDLDFENNVPAWFTSTVLLIAAALLGLIAVGKRREGCRFRAHWAWLAVIFLVLSIDEAVYMHEILRGPLHNRWKLDGLLFFAWIIPGSIAVLIFGLAYWKFLLHLGLRTRVLFVAAFSCYVGGALGLEAVGGALVQVHGYESLRYSAVMFCEEILEMVGVAIFIYALADTLRSTPGMTRIAFASASDRS